MNRFIIIETVDGFEIARVPEGMTALDVARDRCASLVDDGPFPSFESAQEVLMTMPNPYEVRETL